jgi:CBS domain-containing protein
MPTIREILKARPTQVWHVPPEATVYEVLEVMAARDIGAVPIVERGKLVGIFSERDCARHLVLRELSARDTQVRQLMSTPVLYVGLEHTIEDCMALMTEKHVRHLPVLEKDELVGIVSMRDVVRHLISGRDYEIEQLEHYITGTG